MAAIQLIPDSSGPFTSIPTHLKRGELPATLIQHGLINTEIIKVEMSGDNGLTWFQAEDKNGVVQFAATGENTISIYSPILFRAVRGAAFIASIDITSVISGTAVGGGNYARFNHSSGPVNKVGNKILVEGYTTTNVPYNTKGVITLTTTTTFEMNDAVTGLPVVFIGTQSEGTANPLSNVTLSLGAFV